jgi:hypothetical protein
MRAFVTVRRDDLEALVSATLDLEAISAMGVDNWEGWNQVDWPSSDDVIDTSEFYIKRGNEA